MSINSVLKLRVVAFAFILFGAVLIGRLYSLQIAEGEAYREKADRRYPAEYLFDRGSIFFKTKNAELAPAATLKTTYFIHFNPSSLKNPDAVYQELAKIAEIDRNDFMARTGKSGDSYEEALHGLTEEAAEKISQAAIPGISVAKERHRFYPAGSLAAATIGFVAYKGDSLAGRYGLEQYYEDVLFREGNKSYANFFADIFRGLNKAVSKKESLEGNLVLTLEPTVLNELGKTLKEFNAAWNPELTGGIIMDPKDGAIVAMAVNPTFDLNYFQSVSDPRIFGNPLVENVYEMGSIVKPLTLAAGLDAGAVKPNTTYDDKGFLELNGRRISNFDGRGRGVVSMQEVLNQSLNTGAAFVALKMGKERFADYFTRFGLGEETGIDLPNETHGLMKNLESPREIEIATASYGQGVAFTPIETARAMAALGNGGYLVNPHLVEKINYNIGASRNKTYEKGAQVIKRETSEEITRMLVEVVDSALAHGKFKMPRFSVAAKTGTAQMANPEGGGYFEDKYLHSFFGYFPAYQPKFLIFLYTVNPRGANFASETLTRPFFDLTKFLINYYQIPPDR